MSNPTLDLIHCHGSCRNYRPDPVPAELVESIIAAAQCASTHSNLQSYSVVAVTDADRRARLQQICGNQVHVGQAPLFLAWCADLQRLDRACQLRGYTQVTDYVENFMIAAVDAAIVAQTAAIAAEAAGLGVCYIGSIRNDLPAVIELLQLPKLVVPVTGMTVGYPAAPAMVRPRLPLAAMLHWECYDSAGQDEALYEYDRVMVATGIYEGRQVPVPGKPEQVEDYGWMEHSARRVSQAWRKELRQVLEVQGFALK